MKRIRIPIVAVCMARLACGGDDTNNAEHNKTFTYGTPFPAPAGVELRVEAPFATAATQAGAVGGLTIFGNFNTIADELLGPREARQVVPPGPVAALRRAAMGGNRQSADCITVDGNTGTFHNCQVQLVSGNFRGTGTIDGTFSVSSDEFSLSWNVKLKADLTDGVTSEKVNAHESGSVTVEPTRIHGDMLIELTASSTNGGTTTASGVDEEVVFDLTLRGSAAGFCITGGILEAKRVSTSQSGASLSDAAVKITWTGCGHATEAVAVVARPAAAQE